MDHPRAETLKMADSYLVPDDVDALARMLNALLIEHWILYDRVAVLENLLTERGIIEPGSLDAFLPTGEFAASLEAVRERIFSNVLGAASGEGRSVDELRKRRP